MTSVRKDSRDLDPFLFDDGDGTSSGRGGPGHHARLVTPSGQRRRQWGADRRTAMWSLKRESQCGSSFPETGLLSNTCSGTAQSAQQFSQVFGQLAGSSAVTSAAGDVQPAVADTNPADAPYPQWSPVADYPLGYKVTEDGEIYQAKWFNSGDDPQAQVQDSWQTPWELLGPVLPGDHAPTIARLPAGTYPAWSIGTRYQAGDEVLFGGLPYESKWDNQGVSPQTATSDPSGSPWKALYKIPGEPAS
jgi:chitinase